MLPEALSLKSRNHPLDFAGVCVVEQQETGTRLRLHLLEVSEGSRRRKSPRQPSHLAFDERGCLAAWPCALKGQRNAFFFASEKAKMVVLDENGVPEAQPMRPTPAEVH